MQSRKIIEGSHGRPSLTTASGRNQKNSPVCLSCSYQVIYSQVIAYLTPVVRP
jgi:hypothetical protein